MDGQAPIGRRVFLGMLGLGAAGIVAGASVQRGVAAALSQVGRGGGLTALVPGADTFRIYTVTDGFPSVGPTGYRLALDGLVERPGQLSLDDLHALPRTRLVRDFQCVTGWRVPQVAWEGVTLATLLDHVGVREGARALVFGSYDSVYTESLTLAQARRPDVMVAYRFQDRPLSTAHGGPVRLYVAPMYGYKSAKWLSRITVTDRVEPGYWEQQGYDIDAWVGRSNGRSDRPTG